MTQTKKLLEAVKKLSNEVQKQAQKDLSELYVNKMLYGDLTIRDYQLWCYTLGGDG